MAAPPSMGAAVMKGAAPVELEEPPAAEDAPEADDLAAVPLVPAAPDAVPEPEEEAAPLPELVLPEPPTAVNRVVDPMVEVVSALPPDEMVVTRAPATR
jgi:hypothetical protein